MSIKIGKRRYHTGGFIFITILVIILILIAGDALHRENQWRNANAEKDYSWAYFKQGLRGDYYLEKQKTEDSLKIIETEKRGDLNVKKVFDPKQKEILNRETKIEDYFEEYNSDGKLVAKDFYKRLGFRSHAQKYLREEYDLKNGNKIKSISYDIIVDNDIIDYITEYDSNTGKKKSTAKFFSYEYQKRRAHKPLNLIQSVKIYDSNTEKLVYEIFFDPDVPEAAVVYSCKIYNLETGIVKKQIFYNNSISKGFLKGTICFIDDTFNYRYNPVNYDEKKVVPIIDKFNYLDDLITIPVERIIEYNSEGGIYKRMYYGYKDGVNYLKNEIL